MWQLTIFVPLAYTIEKNTFLHPKTLAAQRVCVSSERPVSSANVRKTQRHEKQ
jgi:hypothetical protein